MSETSIEWTHPPGFKGATWNPVVGCRRVSPGCEHCYAEAMAGRLARMGQPRYLDVVKKDPGGQPRGRWNGQFHEVRAVLDLPLRTKKPTCYFVNSMSDLFGEGVSDEWIAAVFGVMAACPQHRFLTLTKRAERMPRWFEWVSRLDGPMDDAGPFSSCFRRACLALHRFSMPGPAPSWPLPNVWVGVSVEDQQRAEERIPHLLRVPAAVRFLSCEPLLGPLEFSDVTRRADAVAQLGKKALAGIDWVIVGGESGPGARPFDLAWARSLVGQCKAAGVPVFVKQMGAAPQSDIDDDRRHCGDMTLPHPFALDLHSRKGGDMSEWPEDLRVREWPTTGERR